MEIWVQEKPVAEKKCTSKRVNRSLRRIVKQGLFKNFGKAHKEWTAAGISASRATRCNHDMSNNFSKIQLDCCSVDQSLLFRWKSISHFIWKENSQSLEEEWKGSKCELPEVQCDISSQRWAKELCHLPNKIQRQHSGNQDFFLCSTSSFSLLTSFMEMLI